MTKFDVASLQSCGLVGIILYSHFLCLVSYRLYISMKSSPSLHDVRVKFHMIINSFTLLELIYNISLLVYDNYTVWGYSFHLFALLANLLAFATVIRLWGKVLLTGGESRRAKQIGLCLVLINSMMTIIAVVCMAISDDFESFSENFFIVDLAMVIVHSFSLLLFSCGLLTYGLQLKRKLVQDDLWDRASNEKNAKKVSLILRINAVLVVCCLCYTIRALLLVLLIIENITFYRLIRMSNLSWFLFSSWIPIFGPGCTFLYIMRPLQSSQAPDSSSMQSQSNSNSYSSSSGYDESKTQISTDVHVQPPFMRTDERNTLYNSNSKEFQLHPSKLKSVNSDCD